MPVLTFDLVVEGPLGGPDGDFLTVSPHALTLKRLQWEWRDPEGDIPPDCIAMEGGSVLVRVGRYLGGTGQVHRYRVATIAKLVNGQLERVQSNAL